MGLENDLRRAADLACDAESVTIISHIDADGISTESILSQALSREGIPVTSVFVRQLEPMAMRHVPKDDSLKVFTDLGAGQQSLLAEHGLSADEVLILDHHVSQPCETAYPQVNSLDFGITRMSAAGIAYLVAKAIDATCTDLAKLAVVGNVGDMMARENCGLVGPARDIVQDGVEYGNIVVQKPDLNCYGTSTRPIHVCLGYCDDPYIDGISNNPNAALRFLEKLGVELKSPRGGWLVWEELPFDDKRTIISALAQQLIAHGRETDRLLAEIYIFPDEPERTPLRNASEYATLLNACGRWAKPGIGGSICRGDRGDAYRDAEYMLAHHRTVIRDLLQYILDTGVTELSHLQYIHTGDRFPDTIVGIGAGMALSKLNWKKPIMVLSAMVDEPEVTKVSMRTNEWALGRGVDLQEALVEASAEVGGAGGGHRIAAGAFIPYDTEEEFVDSVNRILKRQFASADPDNR
ncbi:MULTISPECIES: DHH family phosphoesterase [unclassified Methanoculleus]|uniref:single-stranded-DNA-specific exonuclease RecJ n=1 Tax=unclassified Methanoculleus TaxID=2619537 RepID=UPI0025D9CF70|nr:MULTISPECIES: DHH family phosphoesterase [unclassified Methanoculleus]MCK9317230.1 DHH family phosphoesterase [Methanoculleus sp.]MDD2253189.1 DHH family phosphoesterase [Methanoculleus sp.]MDD2788253.1 DHH family phosphoesterase [Methanoculleus sp.]MDD3215790.1 DHH family phosphoesterase [Methanoculleus sp.]MDD4313774.1 DHH family phosphoesterase [Methanoculleus sp.]